MSAAALAFDIAVTVARAQAPAPKAAALVVHDRPSVRDHELAALRGLYLCEDCGAELQVPRDPQLCGRCEMARANDLESE